MSLSAINSVEYLVYADTIIESLQVRFIHRKIDKFNSKLSDNLKNEITKRVLRQIWLRPNGSGLVEQAKLDVANRIAELVAEKPCEDYINLEGFLQFRMKDYVERWSQCVDEVIDELVEESAYNEFIHVLKSFVELNEPMCGNVHIYFDKNGYRLTDDENQPIPLAGMEECSWFSMDMTNADKLLSTLINLCPLRITMHIAGKVERKGLIQTIATVFEGRVEYV